MSCAPVYREPEVVRRAALEALDSFESLGPREWPDPEHMPLTKDGSFWYRVRDERSLKVAFHKTLLAGSNLFYKTKAEAEYARLDAARRGVLLSLLVHTQLWGRHEVVNEEDEWLPNASRRVLDPDAILNFITQVRRTDGRYRHEQVRALLEKVPDVVLPEDTLKWNETGLTVVRMCWDAYHSGDGGLWCSCSVAKEKLREYLARTSERPTRGGGVSGVAPPPYQKVA